MSIFIPHSDKQERAVFSKKPIVVCATGIQWGKTTVGAVRTKVSTHTFREEDDNFIICAPTYKIMNQSTLPAFLKIMKGCGEYRKGDAEFKIHNGGTVYFRTGTDPDSIVGITNVRHIWGDEAGLFGLYFWENMQARAAFKKAPITLTTSPYTLNWLYKDIIRPYMKNPENVPDADLVQAASIENKYFPEDYYEKKRRTMDPRRFNAVFGGKWEKMEGLVYNIFDEEAHQIEPFTMPSGTKYYGGIDWGYTEPFVLTIRAVTPTNYHFQISETYKTQTRLSQLIEICKQKHSLYKFSRVFCGPDRPENIDALRAAGIPAQPADNSVRAGIDRHYELIADGRYKIFKGSSPYTVDEYELYHYPNIEDVHPDKDVKDPNPVGQHDHCMDSNRYISIHTYKGPLKNTPRLAEKGEKREDQYQRLDRLKRKPRVGVQTEKWS